MNKHYIIWTFIGAFLGMSTLTAQPGLYVKGAIYVEQGAEIYVQGDVDLSSTKAEFNHSGKLEIEGDLTKDNDAQFMANYLNVDEGDVIFKNENFNPNSEQFIDGDFSGSNAFFNLELNNQKTTFPVVTFINHNIEIKNNLNFVRGRIRTGNASSNNGNDYPYELIILSEDPNAITGASLGTENDLYVEGKLRRGITGSNAYFFPVGIQPTSTAGMEAFTFNSKSAPNSNVMGYFQESTSTSLGIKKYCDVGTPPSDYDNPDGIIDELTIDCVLGQWQVQGSDSNPDYDIALFPSAKQMGECNFEKFYVANKGIIDEDCPATIFKKTDETSFGVFDIPGVVNAIALPVELVDFKIVESSMNGNSITLKWITASETNTAGFVLERSVNGIDYESVDWIQGQGTTNNTSYYDYIDRNLNREVIYYYRLKIEDLDGEVNYSEVVSGIIKDDASVLDGRIFPNPVQANNPVIHVTSLSDGLSSISLYNSMGQLIVYKEMNMRQGLNVIEFLPGELQPGTYMFVHKDNEFTQRSTLVVL